MAGDSPEPTSIPAQWAAFTAAPLAYLGELVVVAGVAWTAAWLILKNRYEGKIDGLEQRLSLAKEKFEASNAFAGKITERQDEIDQRFAAFQKSAQADRAELARQIAELSSAARSDVVELVKANNDGLFATNSLALSVHMSPVGSNQTPLPLRIDQRKSDGSAD